MAVASVAAVLLFGFWGWTMTSRFEAAATFEEGSQSRNVGYGEGELTAVSFGDCRLEKTADDGITSKLKIAEAVSGRIQKISAA